MFSQIKCVVPLEGSPRKLQKNAGRLKDAQSYNESTVLLPFALSFPGPERVKADSRRDTGATAEHLWGSVEAPMREQEGEAK